MVQLCEAYIDLAYHDVYASKAKVNGEACSAHQLHMYICCVAALEIPKTSLLMKYRERKIPLPTLNVEVGSVAVATVTGCV